MDKPGIGRLVFIAHFHEKLPFGSKLAHDVMAVISAEDGTVRGGAAPVGALKIAMPP